MENVGTIFNIVLSSANISSACPQQKNIIKPKVRKENKITKDANERRIQEKKKASEIKAGRKKLDF